MDKLTRKRRHHRSVLPETLETRALFSVFWVTNVNDSGAGSLRQAITQANALKGTQTIDFSIGKGAQTIEPLAPLPVLKTPMVINATTQPGFSGTPLIQLDGALAGNADGLEITAGSTTITGLAINRFSDDGILGVYVGGNIIQGNYIGTDLTGSIAEPNAGDGILLYGADNTVGGGLISHRNVISGNGQTGLFFLGPSAGGNIVRGNYIGVNASGSAALGNVKNGLDIQNESGNTIGGTASGAGNVISANGQDGIILFGASNDNTIQGNRVGTDATGTVALGNKTYGIENQGSDSLIGGATPAARNILSANGTCGVVCWGYNSVSMGNTIIGNYIGTDVTGTKPLGNWDGVMFSDSSDDNTLGGTLAADRNIISGNTHTGVGIYVASLDNLVEGNFIGTDVTGAKAIPNMEGVGIFNSSTGNIIGGLTAGAANVISGNSADGVDIGANDTTVEGNTIGLTSAQTATLPDLGLDVLQIGSSGNTILDNVEKVV